MAGGFRFPENESRAGGCVPIPDTVYRIIHSAIGDVGVVRSREKGMLRRIFLPRGSASLTETIAAAFPGAGADRGDEDLLCTRLRALLAGAAVDIPFECLDITGVDGFARHVLMLDYAIPRGRVMTYGGMAARLGIPGGGRAVGNVMARNPFPLIVPCHRVVGSDRSLRGFGGGLAMKRKLLEMEGVAFDRSGRVLPEYLLEWRGAETMP